MKSLTHIRAVFRQAIDDELLDRNPAMKVDMLHVRRPSERFLTLDEYQRLFAVATTRDRIVIRLFMVCGLRPSELFALRVNDVRPGELRVDETIVLWQVTNRTKTEGSRANVPHPHLRVSYRHISRPRA